MFKQIAGESLAQRIRYKKAKESVPTVEWIPIEYLWIDSPPKESKNLSRSPATLDLKIDYFPSSPLLSPTLADV